MLTVTELDEIISSARRCLFRLETLDRYEVPIDGSDFAHYLAGRGQPHNPDKLAWEQHLRAERDAGIWRHRVHLIDTTHGLGDYLRYECEWGYTATAAAGEDIRILDLPPARRPHELIDLAHDFWMIDRERVVRMHYGADCHLHRRRTDARRVAARLPGCPRRCLDHGRGVHLLVGSPPPISSGELSSLLRAERTA